MFPVCALQMCECSFGIIFLHWLWIWADWWMISKDQNPLNPLIFEGFRLGSRFNNSVLQNWKLRLRFPSFWVWFCCNRLVREAFYQSKYFSGFSKIIYAYKKHLRNYVKEIWVNFGVFECGSFQNSGLTICRYKNWWTKTFQGKDLGQSYVHNQ